MERIRLVVLLGGLMFVSAADARADTMFLAGRSVSPAGGVHSFELSSSGSPAVLTASADSGSAVASGTIDLLNRSISVLAKATDPQRLDDAELEASLGYDGVFTGPMNAICSFGPCYSVPITIALSGTVTNLSQPEPGLSIASLSAFGTLDSFDMLDVSGGLRDLKVTALTDGHLFVNFGFDLDPSLQIFDFNHTATLSMLLPEGVTFTTDNITLTANEVPEPASLSLLGLGLAGLGARRWRQAKVS